MHNYLRYNMHYNKREHMSNYKEPYLHLMRASEKAIRCLEQAEHSGQWHEKVQAATRATCILIAAQQFCEELLLSEEENAEQTTPFHRLFVHAPEEAGADFP